MTSSIYPCPSRPKIQFSIKLTFLMIVIITPYPFTNQKAPLLLHLYICHNDHLQFTSITHITTQPYPPSPSQLEPSSSLIPVSASMAVGSKIETESSNINRGVITMLFVSAIAGRLAVQIQFFFQRN